MDDIVRQAMAKWPNVPHCYGWLGLDARGNWYMRDDRAQACGAFASGQAGSKGSLLQHDKLIEFIQRNYLTDALGQWYFQNGPQRVFVELEATPWIWRVAADFRVQAHSGELVDVQQCLLDEKGRVYLQTELGFGLVHTQDVSNIAEALAAGLWQPIDVASESLPQRYAYVPSPEQANKKAGL
jgi:hypothetical protein